MCFSISRIQQRRPYVYRSSGGCCGRFSQLKFFPSIPNAPSVHLMSYAPEEASQRAERVLFEVRI